MRGDCSIRVGGLGFGAEEIAACVERKRLLSIELDLGAGPCRCAACRENASALLSDAELRNVIRSAAELGARRCIIADSNPSHAGLRGLIDDACGLEMGVELLGSSETIDAGLAKFLHERRVTVVLRFEAGKRELFDNAVAELRCAGFCNGSGAIAAAALEVSVEGLAQLPSLWRELRRQGIEPRAQIITPRENEGSSPRFVPPNRARDLFEELGRIDREEFGIKWELRPALTGRSCKRHLFGCHVTPCGTIFACVGLSIPLGNVRHEPLREILELSEVLENLRAFDQKVKEPCGTCSRGTDCYGCRGAAYQLTGDYLTGDPLCWKAQGQDMESLPVRVEGLVPHGKSMRMIDEIVRVGERDSILRFRVTRDCVLVDNQGRLDELAYVEMIAQSFAATHGFHLSVADRANHRGLLLGAKDLTVKGESRVGDVLTVHLRKVTRFGAFGVVEGEIFRQDGELVATSQIKIWRPSDSELEAMAL